MDQSQQEIKNLLKSAKESIKNKQFRETLKLCKNVIDKEKDNYNAWLFTGVAAEELGSHQQALAAYQKAIQLAPNQPTAWQGLAQFFEKQNSYGELVSVYNELRKLFNK
jgi:superkiller protein 3